MANFDRFANVPEDKPMETHPWNMLPAYWLESDEEREEEEYERRAGFEEEDFLDEEFEAEKDWDYR